MKYELIVPPHTRVIFASTEYLASLLSPTKRYVIITDEIIKEFYGIALQKKLQLLGFDVLLLSFSTGEIYKSRETKAQLEDSMLMHKIGKDSCVLGLGGGVVTDLAGFIAATYCRGISFISIPTTLLGMVDASIGGKTGVNTPFGKNLIGAYYPAEIVLIDQNYLKTLPTNELRNGFAEVIKYGFIASKSLLYLLEKDPKDLTEIIHQSIVIKKQVVTQDPRDQGLRHILNFGHTIGHAIETLTDYQIDHGMAVAIGMLCESYLSMRLGHLSLNDFEYIKNLLQKYGFVLQIPKNIDFQEMINVLSLDKKSTKGAINFVLLKELGKIFSIQDQYTYPINHDLIKETYDYFSH